MPNDPFKTYRLVGLLGALEAVAESARPQLEEMLEQGSLPSIVQDQLKDLTANVDLQYIFGLALATLMEKSLTGQRAQEAAEMGTMLANAARWTGAVLGLPEPAEGA